MEKQQFLMTRKPWIQRLSPRENEMTSDKRLVTRKCVCGMLVAHGKYDSCASSSFRTCHADPEEIKEIMNG